LIGAEANAIAPGKRPLSSMSPTIVLKDGRPVLTLGAAGGPTIVTEVVWAIIRFIDLESGVVDAVRLHHQWIPNRLFCESTVDPEIRDGLARLGHEIDVRREIAIGQAISFDPSTGMFTGVHDPRTQGKAAGR
jgi:gamma-glutamyltranspeptidase/glutathione hydrolase